MNKEDIVWSQPQRLPPRGVLTRGRIHVVDVAAQLAHDLWTEGEDRLCQPERPATGHIQARRPRPRARSAAICFRRCKTLYDLGRGRRVTEEYVAKPRFDSGCRPGSETKRTAGADHGARRREQTTAIIGRTRRASILSAI